MITDYQDILKQDIEYYKKRDRNSIAHILEIQLKQLKHWQRRLNPKYYGALARECIERNRQLNLDSDPLSVFRGSEMEMFISNTRL